ncbi:6-phosphogluconolactonase, partial [uncultured Lutibacter sp.]|uniref:6-phosphogluconolactonase n=1 Tax=uncultured Lutibacter sp. TaxID=437739 RepID=UPI00260B03B5
MEAKLLKYTKSITYEESGKFEETRFEKKHNVIFSNSSEGSLKVAKEIADLIINKKEKGEQCVLGLATGSSPIKVYEELVRMHNEEGLGFSNVVTFNLDEYYPMTKDNIQSYYYFMHEHLFNHVDILPENIHVPDGTVSADELHQYCIDY